MLGGGYPVLLRHLPHRSPPLYVATSVIAAPVVDTEFVQAIKDTMWGARKGRPATSRSDPTDVSARTIPLSAWTEIRIHNYSKIVLYGPR